MNAFLIKIRKTGKHEMDNKFFDTLLGNLSFSYTVGSIINSYQKSFFYQI